MEPMVRRKEFHRLARACKFNAHSLAAACQITLRQLERYFAEDFGRGPREWLTEQRMVAATHLLRGPKSVKEISAELGYSRADNFARDFRRAHGLTPKEFQQQRRKFQPSTSL